MADRQSYQFSAGTAATGGYGQKETFTFDGSWAFNNRWTIVMTTSAGDFLLGKGAIAGETYRWALTFKNRVYLALPSQFNLSSVDDPTGWETQNTFAGFIQFLSQFGSQDSIYSFSALQGRLAVLGRRSIQLWQTDADPNQFALQQSLDNTGTAYPLSVQAIGDYDVLYLDDTGVRSLRSKEVTLNAFVDDIGIAIDSLIQAATRSGASYVCSVVEPSSKRYWLSLEGTIYVLTRYVGSKITAWSKYVASKETTFTPSQATYPVGLSVTFSGLTVGRRYCFTKATHDVSFVSGATTLTATGYFTADATTATLTGDLAAATPGTLVELATPFTPEKFVILNGRVYCRSIQRGLLLYGGSTNAVYDRSIATVALPWLDDKHPKMEKYSIGADAAMTGYWHIYVGMNPAVNDMTEVFAMSAAGGTEQGDSTFDLRSIPFERLGTHFRIKLVSDETYTGPMSFNEVQFHYNPASTP